MYARIRFARLLVLSVLSSWAMHHAASPARADVLSISLDPTSVFGTDSSTGTVTLDSGFGRPRTVELTSTNPAVASVPSSVTTDRFGQTVVQFTVTTYPVAVATGVIIWANEGGGVPKSAVVTVRPPSLTSVTFNPNPVRGSENSVATITINRPASGSWFCSIQGPFPPIYFSSGSIVSFTAGSTSAFKTVNTVAVLNDVDAMLTVHPPTGQNPSVSSTLTVVPTRVESITLAPSSVTAGDASLGCVTLNGPAATGGASVQLSSSDPAVATVPSAFQIPASDDDGCFLVQSEDVTDCASAVISATFGGQTREQTLYVGLAERLTDNADNDRWNSRHASTVGGKVLWTDGDDVFFDDGVITQLVQARGILEAVELTVFGLGSGDKLGEVIGAWRRGTDFAWVWRSGGTPVLVSAVNPIDPQQAMNPEAVAIADGSVFVVLQAFFDANSVKHVFRVDPVSGIATNLTGDSAVPGVSRIATNGGEAAWLFVDSPNPKLHYFDGSTVTQIDSGEINGFNLRLARGRLVYEKVDEGVSHIFLYDSTLPNPAPVRISHDTDVAHAYFAPATDGYHVAWFFGNFDQTDLDIFLYGGLQLNDASGRPFTPLGNNEFPLQLNRGQLLWKDQQSALRYAADGAIETLCVTPAEVFTAPWLADGFIAGFGPVLGSTETDHEIYLRPGVAPDDADLPMPPLLVVPTPGTHRVDLEWDRILGASSYNVYLAQQPGVTKDNYELLPGGRRITGITSSATEVCELANGVTYYFVVTTVEDGDEGEISAEVSATPNAVELQNGDHRYSDLAFDSQTDFAEISTLIRCLAGPDVNSAPKSCAAWDFANADLSCDADVDLKDFAVLSRFLTP